MKCQDERTPGRRESPGKGPKQELNKGQVGWNTEHKVAWKCGWAWSPVSCSQAKSSGLSPVHRGINSGSYGGIYKEGFEFSWKQAGTLGA